MSPESSYVDEFGALKITDADENIDPKQTPIISDVLDNTRDGETSYLELQEATNICKAAYKDIMRMAFEAKTWVEAIPALGSLEEFIPPLPGMRVECSIESAVVPISPDDLVRIMMDAERWASCFSTIICWGSGYDPTCVLSKLGSSDEAIKSVLMVEAEFKLPSPLYETRELYFLRFCREIIPGIWAIVDISCDYFSDTCSSGLEKLCCRRPSGLIVRLQETHSQVIWIENVVPSQVGINSGITNSNLAFSAKRWVDALIWSLKRKESICYNCKMLVNQKADTLLLNLTNDMRRNYMDIVSKTPDDDWDTLSDKDVRILRNMTRDETSGLNTYVAVTSFWLPGKPISVFYILAKKNMAIQWPVYLNGEEPEEVIRFATRDDSNCITVHKKVIFRNEISKTFEYLLQETSWDGFCSFIISAPMNHKDAQKALRFRDDVTLQPSGFAIMPDGSNSLNSDGSLVTIAIQKQLNVPETDQAIQKMRDLIGAIVKKISQEFPLEVTHQAKLQN